MSASALCRIWRSQKFGVYCNNCMVSIKDPCDRLVFDRPQGLFWNKENPDNFRAIMQLLQLFTKFLYSYSIYLFNSQRPLFLLFNYCSLARSHIFCYVAAALHILLLRVPSFLHIFLSLPAWLSGAHLAWPASSICYVNKFDIKFQLVNALFFFPSLSALARAISVLWSFFLPACE